MISMVERVARAAYEAVPHDRGTWETTEDWNRDLWRQAVRAAIAALREPTHDMVERGTIATLRLQLGKNNDAWDATRSCWAKMIDAALAETADD